MKYRLKFLLWFCLILFPAVLVERNTTIQEAAFGSETEKPELILQTGHTKTVGNLVFGPDNKWVATASSDNTVKIWDTASGRELRSLSGHLGSVRVIARSPDGKWIASGGNDQTVRLWNVDTGQELWNFTSQKGAVESLAFSPDGTMIATGGGGRSLKLLEAPTGREIKDLLEAEDAISAISFSPDGGYIITGGANNLIKIWAIGNGKKPRTLKGHTDRINAFAFSPDGQFFASSSLDNVIRVWKTVNGREQQKFTGQTNDILALAFISDTELISADSKQRIRIWNPATGREILAAVKESEDENFVEAESAAISSNGKLTAFGYGDRTAALIDTQTRERLETFENQTIGFNSVAFSSDRRWLAAATLVNTIELWDLQSGESLPALVGHDGFVRSVLFHPDNQRIISASLDKSIRIWDIKKGGQPVILTGHRNSVNSIATGKEGKILVSGSVDGTVKLWDFSTLKETKTLSGHAGEVTSVAVSPDEIFIASGGVDKTIRLLNLATQNEQTFQGHTETVRAVAFSPDGQLLASAGSDKSIIIRNITTGQTSTLRSHTGDILTISFSPDGQWLSSGSKDKTTRIWRVSDGREAKLLTGHVGAVNSTVFSSDGKLIASASEDGSICLWRVDTGSKIATLLSLRQNNDWLVVSPQGFFDGSPQAWNQLLWRFAGSTFNVSPVEVFFNEFYQPGLLADLLEEKQPASSTDISKKDRRQPRLDISSPVREASGRKVRIKIKVSESPAANANASGSGARDVRLFRNGSLVRSWSGDVLEGKNGEAVLEVDVTVVRGQNVFTAYAFNRDNVKSSDEVFKINGAEKQKRQGTTYIFSIGVGKYANPGFNLSYIESDVKEFSDTFRIKQSELTSKENVKVFSLLNENATKRNILETFRLFSEARTAASGPATLEFADQIQIIQPEDSVIVYFSGHGISIDNRFYMIPHDLGYPGDKSSMSKADLDTIAANSISDKELEDAFRNIDAGNLLLILDACNSGQAIEAAEKRAGPMNNKGLAQFAYEKGMFILTASQPAENAYVSKDRKQSYLTFALIEEGLKAGRADSSPTDGQVFLREWFDYASSRVPQMRADDIAKSAKSDEAKKLTEVTIVNDTIQRPKVFYRRQTDRKQMVIARFASASKQRL